MGIISDELYKKYGRWRLTASEVAAELNISVYTLKRRIKTKKIVAPLDEKGRAGTFQWHLNAIAKHLGDPDV